eukprot:4859533-Pleurochrysis_carterae.AAC.4
MTLVHAEVLLPDLFNLCCQGIAPLQIGFGPCCTSQGERRCRDGHKDGGDARSGVQPAQHGADADTHVVAGGGGGAETISRAPFRVAASSHRAPPRESDRHELSASSNHVTEPNINFSLLFPLSGFRSPERRVPAAGTPWNGPTDGCEYDIIKGLPIVSVIVIRKRDDENNLR